MDFLIRKVLTETEYAALSTTLSPYDGVVVVSDSDPAVVVKLAIGTQTFLPSSGGDVYAPSDATFLTATDETTAMPNSVDLGLTNPGNGIKSILMNNPVSTGVAKVETLTLTAADSGVMFVDNSGALTQTRTLDFETTGGPQHFTVTGVDLLRFTAQATQFFGNTVGSDTGFDGPTITTNKITSNTTAIDIEPTAPNLTLLVTANSATTVNLQGGLFLSGLTTSAGTTLVLDGANQVFLLTSSARFKENIESLDISLEFKKDYLSLNPVTYNYKKDVEGEQSSPTAIGLIAEEVVKLFPEAVNLDSEGLPFSISYDQISVLTVRIVQELILEIDRLGGRIKELEKKIG